jgi:hypothetical protein
MGDSRVSAILPGKRDQLKKSLIIQFIKIAHIFILRCVVESHSSRKTSGSAKPDSYSVRA